MRAATRMTGVRLTLADQIWGLLREDWPTSPGTQYTTQYNPVDVGLNDLESTYALQWLSNQLRVGYGNNGSNRHLFLHRWHQPVDNPASISIRKT